MATTLEARLAAGPAVAGLPVLRSGHRLFFLGAAVYGAGALLFWLLALAGLLPLDTAWHGHELIWGFAAAAIAGFLTAAVPKWTQSALFAGLPAASLFLLWGAGRVVMATGGPAWLDVAFLPVMAAVVFRRLWRARNRRNFQVAALVLALAACNAAWHAGWTTGASRAAVLLIVALIVLIGGRIVPGFTRNALLVRGLPGGNIGRDERLEPWLVPGVVLLAAIELAAPHHPVAAALAVVLAAALAWRARHFGMLRAADQPIVLVLHLGHAFLPLGLLLWGAAGLLPSAGLPFSASAGLHALTAGGIGGMIVAVASRAARGHAGLPLVASRATVVAYGLIFGGAVLRVGFALAAPLLQGGGRDGLLFAGTLWAMGWVVFGVEHAPMLLRGRRDGLPG